MFDQDSLAKLEIALFTRFILMANYFKLVILWIHVFILIFLGLPHEVSTIDLELLVTYNYSYLLFATTNAAGNRVIADGFHKSACVLTRSIFRGNYRSWLLSIQCSFAESAQVIYKSERLCFMQYYKIR